MRALAIEEYGGPEKAQVVNLPDPEPDPGEVVVRLEAAALNHLDLWTLSGSLGIEHEFPHTLGADGAGVVEAVGEGVATGIKQGANVVVNGGLSCGKCEFCRAGEQSLCVKFKILGEHVRGTFAEYIKLPATNVFPYPQHLSAQEAAALGLTFLTAYRMLFTQARLQPGEWVCITGIGGGLAQALFQLAKPVAGRMFVTSSSDEKIHKALELGADEGVNYADADQAKKLRNLTGKRGVDLIVDSAGGPSLEMAMRALRKGGRIVIAGATAGPKADIDLRRLFWNQLRIIGSTMGSDSDVSDMLRMVAGIELTPLIDRSFKLDEGAEALAYLDSEARFGKVVLEIS
jgi:NADPH:quinone reductase-like Zn-dependent oxidoreductase